MKIRLSIQNFNNIHANDTLSEKILESLEPGVYECEIRKAKINAPDELRRAAQNSIYWTWLTDLQNTSVNKIAGNEKEYWHKKLKHKYLMHIYCRDDLGYSKMIMAVEKLNDGRFIDIDYKELIDEIIKLTSTTQATVKQFSEYLQCIERFCHNEGVMLRTDMQIYKLAGMK